MKKSISWTTGAECRPFAFKYAYLDNGAWEQEIIDPSMNSPFFQSSIAVDGAGIPHVAYSQSWHNATFRYAERINGIWNITVLNASKNAHAPSIAVTSMGDPHICYGNDTEDNNDSLEYLYFDGVQWKREILTKSKYTAIAPQIALDTEGVPHIVYAEGNNDYNDLHVIYTTKNGSTWVNTSFSPAQGDYNYASLALDANGYPHISMTNTIWDDLAYVHWNGTSWIEEVIDYMYSVGYNSDIAVDANGTAHFIYKDCTDWEYIRYATHRPASSNAFPTPPIRALGSWEGDSMVIRWREPHEDGGSNVTKYSIYRGSNLSNDPTPHQKVSLGIKDAGNYSILDLNYTTHQGIYSLRDRNITSGMTYYYYVVAHNEYGASRRSNGVILEINASTILGDHNDTNGESGGDDLDGDGLDTSIHPDEFDDDGGGDEPGSIPQQELNILIIIMIVMTIAAISVAVALIQARRRKNR